MCGGDGSLPAEIFLDEFLESISVEDGPGNVVKEGVCGVGRLLSPDEAEGMQVIRLTGTESQYAYGCISMYRCSECKYASWDPEFQQGKEAGKRRESIKSI